MNEDDIQSILEKELSSIESHELQVRVRRSLVDPVRQLRKFESNGQVLNVQVWLVAHLNTDVSIAFSTDVFRELRLRWGLVFRMRDDVGDSGSWYRSLPELAADCGYF